MNFQKLLKKINLIILSVLSFGIVYFNSIVYAQQTGQAVTNTSSSNLLFIGFSVIILVFLPVLIVCVLYNNSKVKQPENMDEQTYFETQRLYFAAVVLTGLAIVFLESMAMYYWSPVGPDIGKNIFDTCKTVIPPIITLVIGYYFGKTDQRQVSPHGDINQIKPSNLNTGENSDPKKL